MKKWYVGLCKGQQEWKAASNLRAQGYAVYLPKIYVRHQDGRRISAVAHLRFTGYIFIAFDLSLEEHGPISNTPGMDGSDGPALICSGAGTPIALPPGIVETLRAIEDDELARALHRKKPKPRTDLTPGDEVVIAGDHAHPAFGRKGHYLGSEKGWASVLGGMAVWKVAEIDLKKVEKKAAA
jgi:transcription antitermination factor NusG